MKKLLLAALALAALAGNAWATNDVYIGQPVGREKLISIMGGMFLGDSTARVFSFTDESWLKIVDQDRDRDFSQIMNLGISGVTLTPGTSYTSNNNLGTARYVGQFTRGALDITWSHAAAADSDSVLFGVWVYGQVSSTTANRCQWSPSNGWSGNALDSCLDNTAASLRVNDSSNAVCHCLTDPPSFVVTRQGAFSWVNNTAAAGPWYSIIAGQRIKIRKIPGYAIRYASVNGIHLPLSDNAGNPSPFNYLLVKLGNIGPYGNWTLTNAEVNFWGRVW